MVRMVRQGLRLARRVVGTAAQLARPVMGTAAQPVQPRAAGTAVMAAVVAAQAPEPARPMAVVTAVAAQPVQPRAATTRGPPRVAPPQAVAWDRPVAVAGPVARGPSTVGQRVAPHRPMEAMAVAVAVAQGPLPVAGAQAVARQSAAAWAHPMQRAYRPGTARLRISPRKNRLTPQRAPRGSKASIPLSKACCATRISTRNRWSTRRSTVF